jgi:hypothetical protein
LALVVLPAPAYVGPGPGLELIPHFRALLLVVALALAAVLLWPLSLLVRYWLDRNSPEGATGEVEHSQSGDEEGEYREF